MSASATQQRNPALVAAAVALVIALLGLIMSVSGPALPAQADDAGATAEPSAGSSPSASPTVEPTSTSTPTSSPTGEPSESPSAVPTEDDEEVVPDGAFKIDSAVLRWGISNELSSAAYNPGTHQYFVAGKLADPGRGGYRVVEADWRGTDGPVAIEKFVTAEGKYVPATFAGLVTDSNGDRLGVPGSGSYSNHQVVITDGVGEVDRDKKTATIEWDGSFTIVFYSGLSFFYVEDMKLELANGVGTVTATVSGFESSQSDSSLWKPLAPRDVVVGELTGVDLDEGLGFVTTPIYLERTIVPGHGTQIRTGKSWGAFPQPFVDFAEKVGVGPYFYSSGLAGDSAKPALPLSVSYDAGAPIVAPKPSAPTAGAVPSNTVIAPPTTSATPTPSAVPAPPILGGGQVVQPPAPVTTQVLEAPTAETPQTLFAATGAQVQPAETSLALASYSREQASNAQAWAWWTGSGLFSAAAVLMVLGLWPAGVRNFVARLGFNASPRP